MNDIWRFMTLIYVASIKKLKTLSLVFIIFISFPGLAFNQQSPSPPTTKLVPPATGKINVAFVVGAGAEMIDVAGPWMVFERVLDFSKGTSMSDAQPFKLYTVSDSTKPIHLSGGMQIIPDFTFADAPEPNVVVVPGTSEVPGMLDWIRKQAKRSDVVMSVCVGGVQLANAGVLNGKKAAGVGSYIDLQKKFPDVQYLYDMRFVQSDSVIFTSGPLGAGIDLALHVVELYFGRDVAARAANGLNYYGGEDWAGDGTPSPAHKRPIPSDRFSTGVSGNWQGAATTKDGSLQLAVHIWPNQNGKQLVGFAEIVNRNLGTLFIDPIVFNEPDLHFELRTVSGAYDGKLNAQETVIEGTWKQPGASAPLVLKRVKS